ncbi:MAG: alpha/beta hydrolase [Opitutus sp.]|nr:alpha/beta hydrolase [Opitutus sp.]
MAPTPRLLVFLLVFCGALTAAFAQPKLAVPYGNNPSAGATAELNGIKLYYETYGSGEPLLLFHGNSQNIGALGYQIEFFAKTHRVIAVDSRGHGKSEWGTAPFTFDQMAEDANALLDHLQIKSTAIIGWSDGGNVGLLLAMRHPAKVSKLAIMGANLAPLGAYDYAAVSVFRRIPDYDAKIAAGDTAQPWKKFRAYLDLLAFQPNIAPFSLKQIEAAVLVMAGDKDVIRPEHTQLIFESLPKAHLAIFPGATHMIPWEDPVLFNATVAKFLREPYARPDTKNYIK